MKQNVLFGFIAVFLLACSGLPLEEHLDDGVPGLSAAAPAKQVHRGPLRVMNLNLAHGRKDALNQIFLSQKTIKTNLDVISDLVKVTHVDMVALQEADGPSRWSGGFDHVEWLAQVAGYPWYERASHAQSWLFDYGTALLSRIPFTQILKHTFDPSPPTLNKGLILGQITWQEEDDKGQIHLVDIMSVHLDFSRRKVRERQLAELAKILRDRQHPIIILGDFNSDWFSEASIVQALSQRAELQVYKPDAEDLGTYRDGKHRYDWIFISRELFFIEYRVLSDVVSDHLAVVAEIGLRP